MLMKSFTVKNSFILVFLVPFRPHVIESRVLSKTEKWLKMTPPHKAIREYFTPIGLGLSILALDTLCVHR